MIRGRTRRLVALALTLVPLALLANSFRAAPLLAPAPLPDPLPPASPPADVALFQLPTGVTHRSAAFAYRGGSFRDARDFAMTAALVKHPRGDLLVDTGFGRDVDTHFQRMPFLFRAITSYEQGRSAAEQLDATGYDRTRLRGILLTHAHWDHVSGIPEFPGVPVLVNADERRFVDEGGWRTAIARIGPPRFDTYAFEGGAYLGFPRSHDVYGDGSIVVVPASGHTPGSVIVFVALANGHRYAFVGDLAWQREGITEREERPWLARTFADGDPDQVRENLVHMAAIATRFPELTLVPAHDARAFGALPTL
ncbi:MBL fold metallo-hydrolase [Pendulispora rubella]|uniref:MBL fold metallo-hydrolase n=1 Tax=Pendulispora rubella TaxID=2741070 RepID=A0ABZ2L434_9BACT